MSVGQVYYAYGLKIATLSSRKFPHGSEGAIKNNYLYNGKELFEDADLNWYDYGFRNYDPQIGRFTQLDPLTFDYPFLTPYQYASCDPITNIDVDGLEGCPSVGGMVGYVGNAGRMVGAGANFLNTVSTIVRIVGIAADAMRLTSVVVNSASTKNVVRQQAATNAINGGFSTGQVGNSGPSMPGDADGSNDQGSSRNCPDCPPGYASTPKPGGDPTPYFFNANDAAVVWAYKMRKVGMAKSDEVKGAIEFSSEIRSFNVKSGKSIVTLFYSTPPVHWPEKKERYRRSPGMEDPLHGTLPAGHNREGHIHLHWFGSEEKSKGTTSDNRTFSEKDRQNNAAYPKKYMYVLGSQGTLHVRYPDNLPLLSGFPTPDPDAGQERILETGFYNENMKQPNPCRCYKQ
jgi:RHS repeat-associated protein